MFQALGSHIETHRSDGRYIPLALGMVSGLVLVLGLGSGSELAFHHHHLELELVLLSASVERSLQSPAFDHPRRCILLKVPERQPVPVLETDSSYLIRLSSRSLLQTSRFASRFWYRYLASIQAVQRFLFPEGLLTRMSLTSAIPCFSLLSLFCFYSTYSSFLLVFLCSLFPTRSFGFIQQEPEKDSSYEFWITLILYSQTPAKAVCVCIGLWSGECFWICGLKKVLDFKIKKHSSYAVHRHWFSPDGEFQRLRHKVVF